MKVIATTLGLLVASSVFAQAPAGGPPPNGQTPEQAFAQRDTNKDNFLVKAELEGTRMVDRFDAADTDKDGKLSLTEYVAARAAGGQGMGMGAGMGATPPAAP
jgi:hypothetical protein